MNLIVDQGNTVCKWAVSRGTQLVEIGSCNHLTEETLGLILERYPLVKWTIYSSVGCWEDETPELLAKFVGQVISLSADTPVPVEVYYDRSTLGSDRLAVVVGASQLTPGVELLVMDAGTAITYERVSACGEYLGGNISPGLFVRLKGLHSFTKRLPLVDDVEEAKQWGTNTISAMQSGALQGLLYEIEGYIAHHQSEHPEGKIYLTGGDAELLRTHLSQAVDYAPDLVLVGLNYILEYNKSR